MNSRGMTHVERDRPKRASFVKMRLVIALLATLCPVVCYIGRQNLPLAIVSMVKEDTMAVVGGKSHALDTVLNPNPLPDSLVGEDLGLLVASGTAFRLDVSKNATGAQEDSATTFKQPVDEQAQESAGGSGVCPQPTTTDEFGKTTSAPRVHTYGPKYAWDQDQKGLLLGAFFYTYVIFQIPGARLAERVGAKWILAAAASGTSLLSLLSPWAASQHVYLFWAVRVLMGVFQAPIYPSSYVLYARWLPPTERSQALPILGVGAFFGSIVASGLTGYFSEQPAFGWEWSFYVPGVLCALWSAVWIWFASNEPREHKFISNEEIQHIESKCERMTMNLSATAADLSEQHGTPQAATTTTTTTPVKKDISWRKLFTSRAIWIMMVAFFASNWAFTIVLLLVPSYLNSILQVSPMENGMINSVIYILFCIVSPLVGTISTMMVETRACGLSRLAIRKLFQCTALYGLAGCFLAIVWMGGCDRALVFALLFTQIVFYGLVNGGEVQLPAELSPDFSGTIYAIGNCIGSSTGFIVPQVFSLIVTNSNDRTQWNYYFYLAAAITSAGASVFLVFGQNKMQDFSKELGESQLDFGRLGLTSAAAAKGSSFNLVESHHGHYHQRAPGSVRVLPPISQLQQQHQDRQKRER